MKLPLYIFTVLAIDFQTLKRHLDLKMHIIFFSLVLTCVQCRTLISKTVSVEEASTLPQNGANPTSLQL